MAKDFRIVLRIKFLGKFLPTHDDFSTVHPFLHFLGAETCKNIHERTKILLTNIVIFGIKNACYMQIKRRNYGIHFR